MTTDINGSSLSGDLADDGVSPQSLFGNDGNSVVMTHGSSPASEGGGDADADMATMYSSMSHGGDSTLHAMSSMSSMGMSDSSHGDMNHGDMHGSMSHSMHSSTGIQAVQTGSWFDPNTWAGGVVPGDGDDVEIPGGITVTYDGESDARINKVSLYGDLEFATDQNTKIIVDTIEAFGASTFRIGTEHNPVQADVQTQIIIDSQTAVSDAAQIEKGIVTMGTVSIYGADKLDFVAVQDASAGDNKLVLDLPYGSTEPLGWTVGDRIVLGGTDYDKNGSHTDNSKSQDEVLTITAINGNEISFINENITTGDNTVLRFDHARPEGFEDQVNLYVANTTRNVSISTENGASVPIENRGHVMFMHSNDVKVFNAGFYDLGRTDKSRLIDEVGTNLDGSPGTGTNVRGRYAVHFHHVGLHNDSGAHDHSGMNHGHNHSGTTTAGVASGNAIVGSPGWGLVHHHSDATFEDNVVFDVVGSGIVAEGGAETGLWHNNITIKTTGDADPHHGFGHSGPRVQNFDLGFNGEGYWVQGAGQIVMTDNVAVSADGAGVTVFGGGDGGASVRDQHTIDVSDLPSEWQDIAQGFGDGSVVDVAAVPLRQLSGFEAYNVDDGILTWGTMLNSDGQHEIDVPGAHAIDTVVPAHGYRATIDDFQVWQVRQDGVQLWYSSQYDVSNGLLLANESIHPFGRGAGLSNNGKNHTFSDLHVEGFAVGVELPNDGTGRRNDFQHRDIIGSVLEDSYIASARSNFANFGDDAHYFELLGNNQFAPVELESNNQLPVADFETESIGGLAYKFDAASSFDPDPWSNYSQFETRGIIAYAWDFDADGTIDGFGRTAQHRFTQTGLQDVSLTVWDQDGEATVLTETIDVQDGGAVNAFLNGEFSENTFKNYSRGSSIDANLGWAKSTGFLDPLLGTDGALVLSTGSTRSAGVVQVVEDDFIRQGLHQLSVTLKNTDGNDRVDQQNQIVISLFGINGQFDNAATDKTTAPRQVGALPFEMTELLNVDLGGSNYDWQTFDFDINLGSGFEYLVAEINTADSRQAGDFIAIDSFVLS
ncbi:MAG: G8 domain-containing protein [Cyanobacteria bacterium P01_F01_bin.42]